MSEPKDLAKERLKGGTLNLISQITIPDRVRQRMARTKTHPVFPTHKQVPALPKGVTKPQRKASEDTDTHFVVVSSEGSGPFEPIDEAIDSVHKTLQAANQRARQLFYKENPWGLDQEDFKLVGEEMEKHYLDGCVSLNLYCCEGETWEVEVHKAVGEPPKVVARPPGPGPHFIVTSLQEEGQPGTKRYSGYRETDSIHTTLEAANQAAREVFFNGDPWDLGADFIRGTGEVQEEVDAHGCITLTLDPDGEEDDIRWQVGVERVEQAAPPQAPQKAEDELGE